MKMKSATLTAIACGFLLSAPSLASDMADQSKLNSMVEIVSFDMEPAPKESYGDNVVIQSVEARNKTDRTIAGLRIHVLHTDIFGDKLDSDIIQTDLDIKPGEKSVLTKARRISQKYIDANKSKVKTETKPVEIIFEDGEKLKTMNIVSF